MTRRSIRTGQENVLHADAVTLKQARMTAPDNMATYPGIDSQQADYYASAKSPAGGPLLCSVSVGSDYLAEEGPEMHLPPAPPHHRWHEHGPWVNRPVKVFPTTDHPEICGTARPNTSNSMPTTTNNTARFLTS